MEPEIIRVTADITELQKKLDQVESQFGKTEKAAEGLGNETTKATDKTAKGLQNVQKEAGGFERTINGLAKKIAIAFAAEKIIQFVAETAKLAIQMEQLDRKAQIVFGKALPMVTRESERAANAIGLTAREFRSAAAGISDILVPLGFQRQRSAELAVETTKLAGAISQWSGGQFTAAQSAEILQKALVGETGQLKSVGIVVDQSSKQYGERIKLLMQTEGLTQQQARALEILRQITEQSSDAQTSFAESSESMAAKLATANARAREAQESFAEMITPATIALVDGYATALDRLSSIGNSSESTFTKLSISLGALTGAQGQMNFQLAAIRAEAFAAKLASIGEDGTAEDIAEINRQLREQLGLDEAGVVAKKGIVELLKEQIAEINKQIETTPDQQELNRLVAEKLVLEDRMAAALGKTTEAYKIKNEVAKDALMSERSLLREELDAEAEREQALDDLFQKEFDAKIENDAKKRQLDADYSNYQQQLADEQSGALIQAADNTFAAISTIAGENAEAQKALAIFQAVINAYLAITKVLSTVPPPAGPILATSIGALAFAQVAKIQAEQVPSFYTGTDYVALNGNPRGKDTIPAMLHEGEGVVTAQANNKWKGVVKSLNAGNFDKYMTTKHIEPALKALRKEQEQEKAALIRAAISGSVNAKLDDGKILQVLRRQTRLTEELILQGMLKKRNPFRA